MARNLQLLLTENVDSLGIVGDVVNVRKGYARNFLLPRMLATAPSEEKIKALAVKRAEAEKMLAELRRQREEMSKKLEGTEIPMIRSCNDLGILYGAVTQVDLAALLGQQGYKVRPREVRLPGAIKRIGDYDVHIKLDSDLDATIKLHVKPDRELDLGRAREDEEAAEAAAEDAKAKAHAGDIELKDAKAGKETKAEKKKKDEPAPGGGKDAGEKPAKAEKSEKADKGEKKDRKKKE